MTVRQQDSGRDRGERFSGRRLFDGRFIGLRLGAIAPSLVIALAVVSPAWALPPAEDVPEELLREEVILEGRSPIDGRPLSPLEYAELEAELAALPEDAVAVNPELQSLLFQLKLLRLLKDVVPFW